MLDVLRRIVQEVSSVSDLGDALKVVVARIREAMNTEVCSVYLYDAEAKRYVLMATEDKFKRRQLEHFVECLLFRR